MKSKKAKISIIFILIGVLALAFVFGTTSYAKAGASGLASARANDFYLDVTIDRKSDNVWILNVNNDSADMINFEYNAKMCYRGDAEKWKGLSHIVKSTVNATSSIQIAIMENWSADAIVLSYTKDGKRFITYANDLNSSKKTLSVSYTTITA